MARVKKQNAKAKQASSASIRSQKKSDKSTVPLAARKRRDYFKRTPKSERPRRQKVISAPKLFAKSCRVLLNNWKLFAIILVIYALLYLVLVGGLSSANLEAVKSGLIAGQASSSNITATLFSTLLSSGNNGNTAAGVYQTFLLLLISLVLIWAIRQSILGKPIRARDAFYEGTYPLVPFLIVLIIIGLEFIPVIFGAALYNAVASNGIAHGAVQVAIVALIFAGLIALSLFWVSSSVIALYIATRPGTAPVQALRDARQIVRFRRIEVLRKLLFLPLVLFVASVVILMPIARYATSFATIIFFGITVLMLAVVHSYLYSLSEELSS